MGVGWNCTSTGRCYWGHPHICGIYLLFEEFAVHTWLKKEFILLFFLFVQPFMGPNAHGIVLPR